MSSSFLETAQSQSGPVDAAFFRDVAGHFTTGVAVITTVLDGVPAGTTASAVASLSMDPPMMLMCLNRSSATHDQVISSGVFGVNILARNQDETAMAFARKGADKFAGISWSSASNGVPVIDGSLATIACHVVETAAGGTHTVFMGEVIDAATHPGEPLTYYRGTFGRFEHDAERHAYAALRAWVLRRGTPVNCILDPAVLSGELGSRPEYLRPALVRLETEGLVRRAVDGSVSVAPISTEMAGGAFAAQAAIETGVIDTCLLHAGATQLDAVRTAADALAAASASGIEARLESIHAVHQAIVGLSPSRQLLDAFNELSTGALWHHVLDPAGQARMLDHQNLLDAAHAVLAKDTDSARAALRRQLELASSIAAGAIRAHGGTV